MDSDSAPALVRSSGFVLIGAGALITLVAATLGPDLIRAAFEGRSVAMVDRYVSIHRSLDPETRVLSYYVENGLPVLYRLGGACGVLGLLLTAFAGRIQSALAAFWAESARAEDLAIFRWTVFGAMLWWLAHNSLTVFSSLPAQLVVPPLGWEWAVGLLPHDPTTANLLAAIFGVTCTAALVGFRTQWSAAATAVLGVAVMGIPQFYGKIDHYHHFLWFAALLAIAPSGDAWSVDAWLRRRSGATAGGTSRRFALPLRYAMVLMGLMYFFAGVWKLIIGGIEWATGETMQTILHAQWMRIDQLPPLRVDEWGIWTSLGGVAVITFELAFIVLIVISRTRLWAAAAGVLFHLSVRVFTGINFWTRLVCYTVFVDTSWFRRQLPKEEARVSSSTAGGTRIMGRALIALAVVAGALLIDTWPVAVYPTFAGVAEPRAWTLTFEAVAESGSMAVVRPWRSTALRSRYGNSRVAGLVSQVVWAQDPDRRSGKALAFALVASSEEPLLRSATEVRVYRDLVEVDPARWGAPPVRRELVAVWSKARG
ncbi:MAG: HTTM domain-containing protein [Bacteroidota bacterium]